MSARFTSIDDIDDIFKVFDKKGAGKIDASEIGTLVRALGKCPLEKEVQKWVAELNGKPFTKAQLKTYYNKKAPLAHDLERDMREAFKVLDQQGKGYINEAELRQILCTLGEQLSNEEFNLLMNRMETDDDGTMMYDAFVDMLLQ
mmetsp:Transcript_139008/g.196759  ORF Transcript_139008/g.196759 Transcript_139008/m.196759 type:complete len:145 (+) Transcript_139008:20-454(+)